MPLFHDKFTIRKCPARKRDAMLSSYSKLTPSQIREQFGHEYQDVTLSFDDNLIATLDLNTGHWKMSNDCQDENRLLKLKMDILIQMLEKRKDDF